MILSTRRRLMSSQNESFFHYPDTYNSDDCPYTALVYGLVPAGYSDIWDAVCGGGLKCYAFVACNKQHTQFIKGGKPNHWLWTGANISTAHTWLSLDGVTWTYIGKTTASAPTWMSSYDKIIFDTILRKA